MFFVLIFFPDCFLLVAQDKLWHTGERSSPMHLDIENPLVTNTGFFDEVEAQVTDEDLGLGICFDPLSFEQLDLVNDADFIFCFRGFQKYNVSTLYQYIYTSNTYIDPTTRLEYTNDELNIISALYKNQINSMNRTNTTLTVINLAHQKAKAVKLFEDQKLRNSAIDGVENILDNVVSEIRDCIQGTKMNQCRQETFSRSICLTSKLFPNFDHSLTQLQQLSATNAANCIKIYISQIKGPVQRPTKDPFGLLNAVLVHFNDCLEKIQMLANTDCVL
tara:strand:- start:37 stop:864 length:828 start_codon:yes stop_codon:yes gene_type:complete